MPVVIQPTLTRTANGQDMYLPIADAEGAPGVLQLLAGSGITLDPPTGSGVVTVTASGGGGAVTSVSASGPGLTADPTTGAVVLSNTGVTSLLAGTGVSVSAPTGAVTLANTGVTSLVAGDSGIRLSDATGAVTIYNTGVTTLLSSPQGFCDWNTRDGNNAITLSGPTSFGTDAWSIQMINAPASGYVNFRITNCPAHWATSDTYIMSNYLITSDGIFSSSAQTAYSQFGCAGGGGAGTLKLNWTGQTGSGLSVRINHFKTDPSVP